MTINPTPTIRIDGIAQTCDAVDHLGRPVLDGDRGTMLDSVLIRWGRSSIWETPPPAVASATLFDPGGVVIPYIRDGSIYRKRFSVEINPPTGRTTLFLGFITNISVTERTMETSRGHVTGWMLHLIATDQRILLRTRPMTLNMAAQTYSARLASVRYRTTQAGIGLTWRTWSNFDTMPLYASTYTGDQDGFLAAMAATTGDHHQFVPDGPGIHLIQTVPAAGTSAVLMDLGDGATTIRAIDTNQTLDGQVWTGTTLDGCQVARTTAADMDSQATDQVNQWSVRYGEQNTNVETIRSDPAAGAGDPARVVEYRTWLAGVGPASEVADELQRRGMAEGRGPHHPPVEVSTTPDRGFASWTQAAAILRTWEEPQPIALTGSPWTRATGFSLTHVIQGGDLQFTRGRWRHKLKLRRTRGAQAVGFKTRWNHLPATDLRWGADPSAGRYFIPSITWADLGAGTWSLPVAPPQE
ncbi:hypothetical protein [Dietzia sp. 179-F 9C3 NHS]|uniref:hypothetical protein n=1 Tax=Dietzia sp. 179-F 9C3 NHS TaxID=3374295 RepID=UPI0038796033